MFNKGECLEKFHGHSISSLSGKHDLNQKQSLLLILLHRCKLQLLKLMVTIQLIVQMYINHFLNFILIYISSRASGKIFKGIRLLVYPINTTKDFECI